MNLCFHIQSTIKIIYKFTECPKFTANMYCICLSIPQIYTIYINMQMQYRFAVNFGTLSIYTSRVQTLNSTKSDFLEIFFGFNNSASDNIRTRSACPQNSASERGKKEGARQRNRHRQRAEHTITDKRVRKEQKAKDNGNIFQK